MKNPIFEVKGHLRDEFRNTDKNKILFSLKVSNKFISGDLDIFEKSFFSSFRIPRKNNLPLFIEGFTRNFDISQLISGFKNQQRAGFEIKLDSEFQLSSKNKDVFNSSGYLKAKRIEILSEQHTFRNNKPIHFSLKKGSLRSQNLVELSRQVTEKKRVQFLKLKNQSIFKNKKLNLHFEGDVSAESLQFLFPAVALMDGRTQFSLKFRGPLSDLHSEGFFSFEKGFLRLKNFKHSFEDIETKLEIAKNRVFISSFSAKTQ